jgi:hypothetical protein
MVKLVVAALLVACQSHDHDAPARHDTGGSALADAASHDVEPEERADARVKVDEPPEPPDPGKQIRDLGAIPAWQAVVDRYLYLARRGQHGVVFGTLGEVIVVAGPPSDAGATQIATPYTWLVDDTEGNGALAIRVDAKGKPGDRVALAGAWALDDERRYFWKTTATTALSPAPPSKAKDPAAVPGHAIGTGELPNGAKTISVAKEGDAAYFTVVGVPTIDNDGWLVADELGNPPYALLAMPGERATYGAQDMRTADERWQLKRGQTYWVRIGPVHEHKDKPATINARTAPVRVK